MTLQPDREAVAFVLTCDLLCGNFVRLVLPQETPDVHWEIATLAAAHALGWSNMGNALVTKSGPHRCPACRTK